MSLLRAKYARVKGEPGYRKLMGAASIIGTWDDHDYGANDSGKEYPMRAESQQALLDFLDEPAHSPRRSRQGVYEAYTYGPPGRQVKVILLDVRYHRDPPGPDSDVLGEEQWRWLDGQLRGSTAEIHLIGSGIQVIPEDHPYEKWSNFPRARERLLRLIGETAAPGVILLSGDRHLAEISRIEHSSVQYPLWEMTSSGMTHSFLSNTGEFNHHRVRDLLFTGLNFGVMEIDWDTAPLGVTLQVRDLNGEVVLEEVVEVGG
jgi:alkaline phosphatase D